MHQLPNRPGVAHDALSTGDSKAGPPGLRQPGDLGVVGASVTRFAGFHLVGTRNAFEYILGWPSHIMELVQEVEQEVTAHALIAT